ncbi:MAG: ferredoxin-type protein NapF [Mariprofundus sp.]|nr:ferredoxin-type protein NapF [Mariprofundus sp.]
MSSTNLNRRQFLNFSRHKTTHIIRPPWASDEETFQDACTRCGDCIAVCPEQILIREGFNGFPRIDFQRGACTFCADCVRACPTTALNRSSPEVWAIKVHIGDACLTQQQVICTTCSEQCEAGAIRFTPVVGGAPQPEINPHACTGCGACVASCPTQAIEIR